MVSSIMQHRRAYARLEANHDKRKFNFDIEKMAKSRYYTHYIKSPRYANSFTLLNLDYLYLLVKNGVFIFL
jgi:hypothetical protein